MAAKCFQEFTQRKKREIKIRCDSFILTEKELLLKSNRKSLSNIQLYSRCEVHLVDLTVNNSGQSKKNLSKQLSHSFILYNKMAADLAQTGAAAQATVVQAGYKAGWAMATDETKLVEQIPDKYGILSLIGWLIYLD